MTKLNAKLLREPIRVNPKLDTSQVICRAKLGEKPIKVSASITDKSGIRYLKVLPQEPQVLMWMVPGEHIDYRIFTNLNWNIT